LPQGVHRRQVRLSDLHNGNILDATPIKARRPTTPSAISCAFDETVTQCEVANTAPHRRFAQKPPALPGDIYRVRELQCGRRASTPPVNSHEPR
jgi:hypothetical protein